jgi:hypothetical protein
MIAYHYTAGDGVPAYDKTKRLQAHVGQLREEPKASLCSSGLHASFTPEDAARYASGRLWKVAVWGRVQIDETKLVGTHRLVLEEIT